MFELGAGAVWEEVLDKPFTTLQIGYSGVGFPNWVPSAYSQACS